MGQLCLYHVLMPRLFSNKVITDQSRSPIRTRLRTRMAYQIDLQDHVVGIEDQMKQVLATMQQMFIEIKALRLTLIPTSPEALALKQKGGKNADNEEDDNIPDLVYDPVQIIVNKDKSNELVNKLEERVK